MALETDNKTAIALRRNKGTRTELFKIELNNGQTLYLTSGNENVNYSNDKYIVFPVKRGKSDQNEGQTINQVPVFLGDKGFALGKFFLNNRSVIQKATVSMFQMISSIKKGIVFRQIMVGTVVNVSAQNNLINLTVVEPYYDFSKSITKEKWGETPGVTEASGKLSA